jgi:AraC family transcriptional regulator
MTATARELFRSSDLSVRLIHYPPGLRQPNHEHAHAQVSFLLLGGFEESAGRQSIGLSCRAAAAKPAGARHAASFGRWGATMLSLELDEAASRQYVSVHEPCRWSPLGGEDAILIRHVLASGPKDQDCFWDLTAIPGGELLPLKKPPPWLRQAREQIGDAPDQADLASVARTAGVHRVHLSRAFRACFGLTPSLFRSRCMAARAVSMMLDGKAPLASIAAASGFADQSHMTRTIALETGFPPARLRAFFANASSIQDTAVAAA